jgi:DNA-directed RNA polymerase specialized sigma24 family protein
MSEGPLGLESLRYHSPVEHRILLDELLAAEPHAATVIASEIEGLFPAEIARARRSTPGAVALEKHRAMRRLRKRAVAAQ